MVYPSSSSLPLKLELLDDEIHIWCANLDQFATGLNGFIQTLSLDEQKRAQRFYFERDRQRFILGRGVLRTILAVYLSIEPNQIQFSYGKNGKPALDGTHGKGALHFNLSHSEGMALYAFTRSGEIGLDIEYIRKIPEMEPIAEQLFSARERAAFRALPESKKNEAFFNCWTRKEAFIKAIGDGLSQPLDEFDVSLTPGEPARLLRIEGDSKAASRWLIQELKLAPGFAAAFAVERQNWRLSCWQWWPLV